MELFALTAPLTIQAAADPAPESAADRPARVHIEAYSGDVMKVPGFGSLVIDLDGLEIVGDVAILADHKNTVDTMLGTGQATRDAVGGLVVDGVLTRASVAAVQIINMSRDGVKFQASVGVEPAAAESIKPGAVVYVNRRTITAGPQGFTLYRRGRLREVTITPLGCDAQTSVTIAASLSKGTRNMADTTTTDSTIQAAWEQPGMSDPQRIQARYAGRQVTDDGLRAEAEDLFLRAGAGALTFGDFDRAMLRLECRDANLRACRADRPQMSQFEIRSSNRGGATSPAVLQAAFLSHLGHGALAEKTLGAAAMEAAAGLRVTHFLDLCKHALTAENKDVPATRDGMLKAAFSTFSLPNILGDAANKLLMGAYNAFPSVARIVAKKLSASDFKAHAGLRLTGDSKFRQVPPAGEIQHGTLSESRYAFRVDTYARMFGLTRQDVINDDLGAFEQMPQIIGRGAAVALEEAFWKLVLANTGSFFAGVNYISGTTTALSIEGLRQAVQKIRQLVDATGAPISVTPKYLVVPPELEATADALYASTNIVMAADVETPDGNPYRGKYLPLVVPHLSNATYSGYSASAWYLLGDPADVPAFGIAYLNNMESPTVETSDADFSTLGVQMRGYLDFGVCQVDRLGGVKSAGA